MKPYSCFCRKCRAETPHKISKILQGVGLVFYVCLNCGKETKVYGLQEIKLFVKQKNDR